MSRPCCGHAEQLRALTEQRQKDAERIEALTESVRELTALVNGTYGAVSAVQRAAKVVGS